MPWEETCFPQAGGNITLPPNKNREVPLTIYIPAETGTCASQSVAHSAVQLQAPAADYAGPCRTVTDFGCAGPTPTTYRFAPDPEETLGLAIVCKSGDTVPYSCDACSTYTKVAADCPTPVTVFVPPSGAETDGCVLVIAPIPDGIVTDTQALSLEPDAFSRTMKTGHGPEGETITYTVPIPLDSSYETTITATDGGPDTVIIGDPAAETPDSDPENEDLPGLPTPTETGPTTIPEQTEATTTEEVDVTPTFVFGDDAETTTTGDPDDDEGGEATTTGTDDEDTTADPGPAETVPPVDSSCDNAGFRYAMVPHNFFNNDAPTYTSADVDYFRTANPVYVGRVQRIGTPGYPGAPDFELEFMAFNHEAYLYAKIAGEYTITVPFVDDIVFIWVGQYAYEGWTRANADGEVGTGAGSVLVVRFPLAAGEYVPIRILFVNGQGGRGLDLTIRNPDGDFIAGSEGVDDEYIVTGTCSDVAPDFPAFPEVQDPEDLVEVS
jgi:hypothetical protein